MLEGLGIYEILKNRKTVTLNIIKVTHFHLKPFMMQFTL
jgi:hypothetical protein